MLKAILSLLIIERVYEQIKLRRGCLRGDNRPVQTDCSLFHKVNHTMA
jgi:hypothetical protein